MGTTAQIRRFRAEIHKTIGVWLFLEATGPFQSSWMMKCEWWEAGFVLCSRILSGCCHPAVKSKFQEGAGECPSQRILCVPAEWTKPCPAESFDSSAPSPPSLRKFVFPFPSTPQTPAFLILPHPWAASISQLLPVTSWGAAPAARLTNTGLRNGFSTLPGSGKKALLPLLEPGSAVHLVGLGGTKHKYFTRVL